MKLWRIPAFGLFLVMLGLLVYEIYFALDKGERIQPETKVYFAEKYGKPLAWNEVSKIFPRYSTAVLVDVETGKKFEVVRRGGTYHADIQPVTNKDTQVLKELYPYGWSWKRRAVTAQIGQEAVAASINGMPHGAGKIQGNEFKGHFCIHFKDSRVHLSRKVDLAHQMMVWKAAGQPLEPFSKASPQEVVDLVLTALNQDDPGLAALGITAGFQEDLWLVMEKINRRLPQIDLKRLSEINTEGDNPELVNYHVVLKLNYPGERGIIEHTGELAIIRSRKDGRWLIKGQDLISLLKNE